MGLFLDLVNEYLGIQKAAHDARMPYQWGAKEYLSGFEIGETKEYKENYKWDSLKALASRLKRDFGVQFQFRTTKDKVQLITRVL